MKMLRLLREQGAGIRVKKERESNNHNERWT